MKRVVRLVLWAPVLGLAVGCTGGSNESQADIQGTAPVGGEAVPSTIEGRLKYSEQQKPQNLKQQGYPGT